MRRFHVGDRVITGDGRIGTVSAISDWLAWVEFDGGDTSHRLWSQDFLKPCPSNNDSERRRIFVVRPGNPETKIEVRDGKNTVDSASVRCNPKDRYDEYTGVRLAVDRMYGKPLVEQSLEELLKENNELKLANAALREKLAKSNNAALCIREKYNKMTNHELFVAACGLSACCFASSNRNEDCPLCKCEAPFCDSIFDAHSEVRDELIEYLVNEEIMSHAASNAT